MLQNTIEEAVTTQRSAQINRILLVYPRVPDTFWSFSHILPLLGKRAYYPPLGLLTVAGFLPRDYELRLVDINVRPLNDEDLDWADAAFITGMSVQVNSLMEVVQRCKAHNLQVIAGGPFVTSSYGNFDYAVNGAEAILNMCVNAFVLGEGEEVVDDVIADLRAGTLKPLYQAPVFPSLERTPVPRWDLVDVKAYQSLSLQLSRGCPFDCEFCDIVVLNGHKPRTKSVASVLAELDAIYATGFRGSVLFVDDNFIGNIRILKAEILPAILVWQSQHRNPFTFHTEASMNLVNDIELIDLMVKAGFRMVFVGIETPSEASLKECGKVQNIHLDLLAGVKLMQEHGLTVNGGFIVGFDSDDETIFDRQIRFIQDSGICFAMVGILQPIPKTRLFTRLKAEGRLLQTGCSVNNTSSELSFVPRMGRITLLKGYKHLLATIYSPKFYFARAKTFLKVLHLVKNGIEAPSRLTTGQVLRMIWTIGFFKRGGWQFWKILAWALRSKREIITQVLSTALAGYHFEKIARTIVSELSRVIESSIGGK